MSNQGWIWSFSRRKDGNMSLTYGDTKGALENRKKFLEPLGINYRDLVCTKQTHSANIYCATVADKGKGALEYESAVGDTDALITAVKGVPLAIFTADCLSVFLFDPKKPAIAVVHAGWRSSKEQILAKTIRRMQEEFKSSPTDLIINFGSSIRSCCCEVTSDFKDFFPGDVSEKEGRLYLDLAAANIKQARSCGARMENISDPKLCTFCAQNEFFSFRKEADTAGRMISVAMLK